MITKILVGLTFFALLIKVQIYQYKYAATTTPAYREKYGRKTYNNRLYVFAVSIYMIACLVAMITFVVLP